MSTTDLGPTTASPAAGAPDADWWRGATIYQVYPRSFADANGDGTGDLAGVRARLPYLASLGIDAIWFTPWYPSPMADGGYDVADYRAIDPLFGDLAEAEGLIADALALGIRTIIDIVPNHVSAAHPWFQQALAAGPGSPERERFWFRDGLGTFGALAPNRWESEFGGPAWSRVTRRRRRGRAVVPPPLRPRPARPQLAAPRRPPRPRGDPAVLVRPRRGRHPHRLGRARRQGPGPARGHARTRPRRAPVPRPRRAPGDLPVLAGDRRLLRPGPRARRRGVAGGRRPVRPLPAPGRAAHGVQLRLHGCPLGRRRAARLRRAHPGRARAGGRPGHVGALQPRRHPPGDPLRPHRHGVRVRDQAVRHPDRRRARSPPGAGRGPAGHGAAGRLLPLPGRGARAARGRGTARPDRGPDALALRRGRPRPRRLPRAAAVGGRRAAVRVQQRARWRPGSRNRPTGPP